MSLTAAAKALNAPEAIVKRSAEARAKTTGMSVDEILTAWAGGGDVPSAPTGVPDAPSPVASGDGPQPPIAELAGETIATPSPAAAASPTTIPGPGVSPLPAPTQVNPREALGHDIVVTLPTVGLTERTGASLPRWLSFVALALPVFGLLYLSGNIASGGCVEGGFELGVDRQTGAMENCDGSAFEGKGGAGGAATPFLAEGRELYAANCAGCHGPAGAGAGAFPAMNNVNVVFSKCTDHLEWVTIGTLGFKDAGRGTYGDTAKPVGGSGANMPGFAAGLTPEQLAAVVAYERVSFGGGDAETVLVDCGLVAPEAGVDVTAPASAAVGRNG